MELTKAILSFLPSLAWPAVVVYALILFQDPIAASLARLETAELPGGISVSFAEKLEEAKTLAENITLDPPPIVAGFTPVPSTEINRRLVNLGLRPSPSSLRFERYQRPYFDDAVLALAGLRTEVDAMIRNLADGFEVDVSGAITIEEQLGLLRGKGAILDRQFRLASKVIALCDAAIRGVPVSEDEAWAVIDIAKVLADEYARWLSWGFPQKPWQASPEDATG